MRCVLFMLLTAPLVAQHQDWPTHRADLARSGRTQSSLEVTRLRPVWTYQSRRLPRPAWPGPARWDAYAGLAGLKSMRNYDPVFHPIAVGERIWFGSSSEDTVVCLDAPSGSMLWEFVTGGPVRVAPTWVAGRLYFGSDDGSAYCLDAGSGELLWRFDPTRGSSRLLNDGRLISAWPVRTGVAVDGGTAYFAASMLPWQTSYVCAVDALTGEPTGGVGPRYVRDLGTGWTMEGATALSSTDLVIPQGRVAPLLFDRQTGASRGTLQGGGGSFCLVTEDDSVLHGPGNKSGWITDSRESTGEAIASYERGNAIVIGASGAFMLSDETLGALDRASGSVLWSVPTDATLTMVLAGEHLILGGDGRIEARDALDGRLVWETAIEGRAHGLAVARGRLLVATDLGELTAFEASGEPLVVRQPEPGEAEGRVLGEPPAIDAKARTGLLDHWLFQSDTVVLHPFLGDASTDATHVPHIRNQVPGGLDARVLGALDLRQVGDLHVAALDGSSRDFVIAPNFHAARMPARELSVEAWVRVDRAQEWGGILGAAQDNGEYEKGWMLGFRGQHFGFALNAEGGEDRLHWLTDPGSYAPGSWHHVVGTYDGTSQELFVDGELVSHSEAQNGAVSYPENARYHLGAYRDDDEYFRMAGMLRSVSLWERALELEEVATHHAALDGAFPAPPETQPEPPRILLSRGPVLEFVDSGVAEVTWELEQAAACSLVLEGVGLEPRVLESKRGREHTLRLEGLRAHSLYTYSIRTADGASETFECDTHFDYTVGPGRGAQPLGQPSTLAASLLQESRLTRGVALVLGCGDGSLAAGLAAGSQASVIVITGDAARASELRTRLLPTGDHGRRVSVLVLPGEAPLPLPRAFANLVVTDPDRPDEARKLVARGALQSLRPFGGLAYLPDAGMPTGREALRAVGGVQPTTTGISGWTRHERGALEGAGVWTHMYGTPDNSAFGGEELAGATSVDDLEVQWAGRPGPRYQSDRGNRKPSPLAVNGRLFVQGLMRVIAIDAFNGSILWARELPELQRFNIPRSSSNWCADEDSLYLALGSRVVRLDAATGKALSEYELEPPRSARGQDDSEWEWGYLASTERGLLGSTVRRGGHHTRWWGSVSWYDAKEGDDAAKVVSESLFLVRPDGGRERWQYEHGLILDATITQSGESVWFVESRDPDARALGKGRVHEASLWNDLHLVCLDLGTGKVRWDVPAKPMPGTVAFYLAYSEGRLVMLSSDAGFFALYAMDGSTGEALWRKKFAWEVDHHGKHLSRPLIVGGEIFVRPLVLNLITGDALAKPFPEGHQCGTYTASTGALFLRAGELAVWDREGGGATRWNRLRPDCWISTIPASGMLLSPEGGGGCSCGSWIEASVGFLPK